MSFRPEEIFVFLGPSLSLEEAKGKLDAIYLPPAKQGDILSLTQQFRPKVIALIDGYFLQNLSVWHKEILYAISQGITLLGASSMGALRAAETADFGMIGVGKIFELYKSGEIIDDDEVVLVHGPAEEGYLPLSLPLINIRFTLKKAQQEGQIPEEICATILAAAQSLYYPERTIEKIAQAAAAKGLSQPQVAAWLEQYYVDQKKEDALELLEKIKRVPAQQEQARAFPDTSLFQALYHCDRRVFDSPISLTQMEIAQHVALHHPDFSNLRYHALNQILLNFLAKLLHVEVSHEEIEEEKKRFCLSNNLLFLNEKEWDDWFARNHITKEEFEQLMKSRAKTRKMQLSFSIGEMPWKQTKSLLDELKLNNSYEEWFQKAAEQEKRLSQVNAYYFQTSQKEIHDESLLEAHLNETGWHPDGVYTQWAEEAGFESEDALRAAILKTQLVRK